MRKFLILLGIIAAVYFSIKIFERPELKADKGPTIIWASIADASYLNPILASDSASGDINGFVYSGLIKYDKDLKIVGDLAENYSISKDNLQITFKLRQGVRWHDGYEFDANDVKFTYELIKDTATRTPYSSRFDKVKSLTTPDDHTVIVKYTQPYSPALESWGIGILPEHIYKGTDVNTNPYNRKPIGTGPYKFVSWKTDDRIILEANDDYFEGKPAIGRIFYKIIPDIAVQFMELKRGGIDWMGPSPDQWIRETSKDEFKKKFNRYRYSTFSYTYMGYNLKNHLFRDKNVRIAINYAVDKKKMIEAVLQGMGQPASAPYPPNSWAYNPKIKDAGYDPDKARELLSQAGWKLNPDTGILEKNGKKFSFTLMTNQGNNKRKLACEIIQDQLKKVGINVKVRIQEWSSFIHQYIDKRQFDAILIGWSLSIDPDQYSIWHSSQQGEGKYNLVGYSNREVDKLLESGRTTFDFEKRKRIYNKIQEILAEDQPYLFLYFSDSLQVIQNRFQNIKIEKAGITYNFIEWSVSAELRKY